MKSMIYGAGSLGTILGGLLTEAGEDILLVSRNRAHISVMKENGIHIIGGIDKTIPSVKAALPEEITGRYDVVFLMTKQLDNPATAKKILPFLTEDGVICCLQNGIPELTLKGVVEDRRIIGGIIPWSATFQGAGVSELTSPSDSIRFSIGSPFCRNDAAVEKVRSILSRAGKTEVDEELICMRWSKLLVNASVSAFSSSLGLPCGGVIYEREYQQVCLSIMKECIDAGHASGIVFRPVNDYPIAEKLYFEDSQGLEQACARLPEAFGSIRNSVSSILQDLRKGRKTEVHAINGIVCAVGREKGIPTPFNDCVVRTIEDIENGKADPDRRNLSNYTALIG